MDNVVWARKRWVTSYLVDAGEIDIADLARKLELGPGYVHGVDHLAEGMIEPIPVRFVVKPIRFVSHAPRVRVR